MTPRQADAGTRSSSDLFRERLDNMLNQRHAKVAKRYEFGVKAGIATTNRSNFVVGGMALPVLSMTA